MPLTEREIKETIGDLVVQVVELRKQLGEEQGRTRQLAEKLEEALTRNAGINSASQ